MVLIEIMELLDQNNDVKIVFDDGSHVFLDKPMTANHFDLCTRFTPVERITLDESGCIAVICKHEEKQEASDDN